MGENTLIISLILFNIALLAFVGGIVVFIKQYRLKKKKHEKELEITEILHKEELLQTQVEIQEQTMKHIGREIHDNVGQKLTLSSLYLQKLLINRKHLSIEKELKEINIIINDSLQELRHLSQSLTDDSIHQHSISELIDKECKKINQLKKCSVNFQSNCSSAIHAYQIKSVLLRSTQEFLQNSIKHADCNSIEITLQQKEKSLLLELKDDGKGFNPAQIQSKGIGLKNMQKRTEMIGGEFQLSSKPKNGTQLILKIPTS